MRYEIKMIDGSTWKTDFESGRAPYDPSGTDQLADMLHVIADCGDAIDAYVSLNVGLIVSVVDTDCG